MTTTTPSLSPRRSRPPARRSPTTSVATTQTTEPPLFLHRLADGRRRLRDARGHFPDRTRDHLRPARRRAQHEGRPVDQVDAASSTPTTCTAVIERSGAVRWTCSPAAAARSTPSPSSPRTRRTSARSSPTSRRWPPSCRTRDGHGGRPRRSRTRYQQAASAPAMAHFIAIVVHKGEFPDGFADAARPEPAMFGMPTGDDGTRTDVMLGPEHHHLHPLPARRRRPARRLDPHRPGRRRRSPRASWPTAARSPSPSASGRELVVFPGDHGGFLGGEYGQSGEPDAFAAKLREVLDRPGPGRLTSFSRAVGAVRLGGASACSA